MFHQQLILLQHVEILVTSVLMEELALISKDLPGVNVQLGRMESTVILVGKEYQYSRIELNLKMRYFKVKF